MSKFVLDDKVKWALIIFCILIVIIFISIAPTWMAKHNAKTKPHTPAFSVSSAHVAKLVDLAEKERDEAIKYKNTEALRVKHAQNALARMETLQDMMCPEDLIESHLTQEESLSHFLKSLRKLASSNSTEDEEDEDDGSEKEEET